MKIASHPASHSWPMEINVALSEAGTVHALRAFVGRRGMSKSPASVAHMMVPLGLRTAIGFLSSCLLVTGMSRAQNVAAQPVSAMALDVAGWLVGGPIRDDESVTAALVIVVLVSDLSL